MAFIARGVISDTGSNAAWVGKYTYVSQPNIGFYQWDGMHKVMYFSSPAAALAAAGECLGPLLQLPDRNTIEAVEVSD